MLGEGCGALKHKTRHFTAAVCGVNKISTIIMLQDSCGNTVALTTPVLLIFFIAVLYYSCITGYMPIACYSHHFIFLYRLNYHIIDCVKIQPVATRYRETPSNVVQGKKIKKIVPK